LIASIRERHRGRTSKRISLDLAREQGNDLIELKTACRHGEFRTLIQSRLPFGYSVASDLMKISRQLGNLGRRNARGSLSVRQALSLIERWKTTVATTVLSERARTKLAAMATKPPTEADQCRLIEGDCLEEMGKIPDRSVDLILSDLPFGNSGLGWDRPIDLAVLWQHYRRVIKPNHPIVLFASQPFSTDLINAARDMFKYEWIWIKHRPTGSTHAKNKPMKKHENILVFSSGTTLHKSQSKRRMPYYPQGLAPNHRDRIVNFNKRKQIVGYRPNRQKPHLREFTGYPNSVLEFPVDELGLHPVAKPVGLLEFLIETLHPARRDRARLRHGDRFDWDRRRQHRALICWHRERNRVLSDRDRGAGRFTTGFRLTPDPRGQCRSTTVWVQLDVSQTDQRPVTG
jgi:site-specific DNA-methyltransferase (adenine-specific)